MERAKFRMPTAYTILFLLIILVALCTWLVPAGAYQYVNEAPVAGTYHAVAQSPQGAGAVLKAAFAGFYDAVDVCVFILMVGGFLGVVMKTGAVVAYGTRFLRCMCVAQPFLCLDFLAVGVFQACGLGRYSLVFALLRKIVLEIPALYVLNYFFPLYGLACAQAVAEVALAAAAAVILTRLFRRMEKDGTPLPSRAGKK